MSGIVQNIAAGDRRPGMEPLAAIDIGSNSVRLVVYEGAVRSPTPVFNEKILCGLGRSVASTGTLGDEAVVRAINALIRFKTILNILRVKNVKAVATAAVRDASNGAALIAAGEAALGCDIEVLSGAKEAELAAFGILMGFVDPDGVAGDLGGGSLELIDIQNNALNEAATVPLGGLRLIDTTGNRLDKAVDTIDAALAGLPWLQRGKGRSFYAVGGTWRALAKLHMEGAAYPLRVMHGYTLTSKTAQEFCESIRKVKRPQDIPGLNDVARARREVLPYGALVLERLIKTMQPDRIVFSVFGVREGLIYAQLPEPERRRDPLLSFSEDFAALRSRSLTHAFELCRWTDDLFSDPEFAESADERRLRHAACLLSDIGWRAHPDYRGEKSLALIAHSALSGVDHAGRIYLALSTYYRHESSDPDSGSLPDRLKSLVSKRLLRRARMTGSTIRVAHMLSIGMAGVIDETPLTTEDGKIVLSIPRHYAGLDGERLRRRLGALAELAGRQPVVRFTP